MPTPARLTAWWLHLVLITLVVVATYAHTLDVPFYLDDESSIRENPVVTHWQGFGPLRDYAPMRWITYLTFALDYRFGHFDPAGYHRVNLLIHVLAGFAVYGLARGLWCTRRVRDHLPGGGAALPLVTALLFVVHPLQTQAVTYIVQRLASLVALFYVASLAAYVQARLASNRAARLAWWGACGVCAALALFTKENAVTLPLAMGLIELIFFARSWRDVAQVIARVGVAGIAIWLISAFAFGSDPFSLPSMGGMASHTRSIARDRYLATQLPMLWTYLRLFVWPMGLHLDYANDGLHRLSDARVLLALAGHLSVVALAIWAWRRRPVIAFGLLFMYLAHAVESGVIPIPELAFEHRAYLPNLGLCLAFAWLLTVETPRRIGAWAGFALTTLLIIALGVATWKRNQLWRDPVLFWTDNVRLAPTKARAWGNLGKSLLLAGRAAEAIPVLERSLELRPRIDDEDPGRTIDVTNLVGALDAVGRHDEARAWIDRTIDTPMPSRLRATLLANRGNIALEQNQGIEAERAFREALAVEPDLLMARANLASALARDGHLAEAESLYQEVLRVDPDDRSTRMNLLQLRAARLIQQGDALSAEGHASEAQTVYREALDAVEQVARLAPDDPAARANVDIVRSRLAH